MAYGLLNKLLMGSPQRFDPANGVLPGGFLQSLLRGGGGVDTLAGGGGSDAITAGQPSAPQPMQPQGGGLSDLLNPEIALPMAGALMSGPTFGQGLGQALDYAGQGIGVLKADRKAEAARNQTKAYLAKNFPQIASLVDAGMPIDKAWDLALKPKASAKAPDITELYDANGQPYKAQWNADSGKWDRIGGTKAEAAKQPNEYQMKNRSLYAVIAPEGKRLLGNGAELGTFDALAEAGNQWKNLGTDVVKHLTGADLSNYATSPQYQQAKNSMRTVVASYLYSTSGATANPGEVENQITGLLPSLGESQQSVNDKKARLQTMIEAVGQAANGVDIRGTDPAGLGVGGGGGPAGGSVGANGVETWVRDPKTGQIVRGQ